MTLIKTAGYSFISKNALHDNKKCYNEHMKRKFRKIKINVAIILTLMLCIRDPGQIHAASTEQMKAAVWKSSNLLKERLRMEYKEKEDNLKVTLKEGEYDYTLSMEHFYRESKNPLIMSDMTEIIAAYIIIQNEKSNYDTQNIEFLSCEGEVKEISMQQIEWLLQGLEIEQKKAHHEVNISLAKQCF